ncbi:DUF6167 family protein [Nocardioides sp. GY 10127]|uniref:DUF6167 family protein n=1 Tax=Nocardioides sp. GY 10127 TaxID=2569762 RepID=UPI0010A7D4A6|nr:DUF6167 family protein [Nocardioides sp. GY 10127]TIC85493.1 hypothetical protein E8D37_02325 [Nocardioides sp. GY 10127]
MSRGLWFVAGAGAGAWAVVRARRVAEALTADGLRDRLAGLAVGARMLRDEVAQGRAEAETDLRERLGVPPDGARTLGRTAGGRRPAQLPARPATTPTAAPDVAPTQQTSQQTRQQTLNERGTD